MEEDNNGRKKDKESGIADVIKKVVSIGVGAAFMTEDAVKNILGDLPLPKDIVSGLVQNAKGAKKEFSDGVRKEFREYLTKLDLTKLVSNALENYDFNIQATVTLKKKNGDKKSDVVVSTESDNENS
tara:strand:+ start:2396 stop:2776 length:381 start_codon:yes stop_codon:yes gene_type:complete